MDSHGDNAFDKDYEALKLRYEALRIRKRDQRIPDRDLADLESVMEEAFDTGHSRQLENMEDSELELARDKVLVAEVMRKFERILEKESIAELDVLDAEMKVLERDIKVKIARDEALLRGLALELELAPEAGTLSTEFSDSESEGWQIVRDEFDLKLELACYEAMKRKREPELETEGTFFSESSDSVSESSESEIDDAKPGVFARISATVSTYNGKLWSLIPAISSRQIDEDLRRLEAGEMDE